MTDAELDRAITAARKAPDDDQGAAALAALRDQITAERGDRAPALGPIWDAIVEIAERDPDHTEILLTHAEARARWATAAHGPGHPLTLEAWSVLGDAANQDCAWDVASRAWEAIVSAPIDTPSADILATLAHALRGLGSIRLSDRPDEARSLFERDLDLSEHRPTDSRPQQVAISLDNLALAHERLGDRARALELRRRQRDSLIAAGAGRSQLQLVDQRIAALSAA